MDNLTECPHCHKLISSDRNICTFCGKKVYDNSWVEKLDDFKTFTNDVTLEKIKKIEEEEVINKEKKLDNLLEIKEKPKKKSLTVKGAIIIAISIFVCSALVVLIIINNGNKNAKNYYQQNLTKYNFSKAHVYDDMQNNGFSKKQIEYALEKNYVDFNVNALKYLSNLITSDTYPQNKDMTEFLMLEGFNETEVNYAMENFDKDKFISDFCISYLKRNNDDESKTKLLSKNKILDNFKKIGMSNVEISLVKTKLDWKNYSYDCLSDYLSNTSSNKNDAINYLNECGYVKEEIDYAVNKINWQDYAKKSIEQYIKENEINKKDILEYLQECGYDDDTIDAAIYNFDWNAVALDDANDYIDNSENIVTRLDVYNHLKNNLFSNEEIAYALAKIDFEDMCVDYLNKLIKADLESNSFKCVNKTYIIDSLSKGGFENKDINSAKDTINWQDYANKSVTKLIEYAQANNYDLSSYGKNTIKNLLTSAGYSIVEVTDALGTIDWKDVAVEYLKECIKNKNYDKRSLKTIVINSGLSSSEADKAFEKIDWNNIALQYANTIDKDYSEVKQTLENHEYSSSEVDYALEKVDWKQRAVNYAKKNASLSRYALGNLLRQHEFSDDVIEYAKENSGIDYNENCYREVLTYGSISYICENFDESIKPNLVANGYTDSEISYARNKISES